MVERDEIEADRHLKGAVMDSQAFTPDWFSKPGDSLRAIMARRGLKPEDVAEHLSGGMITLKGLLDGSSTIDGDSAKALAASVGGTTSFWLKRQSQYHIDLERALDRAVAVEVDDWLSLPVPGDRPRGRLTSERQRAEVRRRLAFFNVGTMRAWEARYGKICTDTLFRTSHAVATNNKAVLMWLRSGELSADLVATRPWSAGNLQDRLEVIRGLSRVRQPERFLPKLRELCAEAGVAVVAKRAPPGCPASGASRMVASDKAMILFSFRGLSDDRFWFTVFHEIAHLLLHGAESFVDSEMDGIDTTEQEANEFASRCIIPPSRLGEFSDLRASMDPVVRFSVSVGIAPGLTVGQMQHRRMIKEDQLNFLKRRWTWNDLEVVLD